MITPRFHPAYGQKSVARVLCNGRSRPGLLGFPFSGRLQGGDCSGSGKSRLQQARPLSGVFSGQRPYL